MIEYLPLNVLDVDNLICLQCDFPDGWSKNTLTDSFNSGRFYGIKACDNGKIVGFISYSLSVDTCDIEDVFVDKNYRRKKIASALLKQAITEIENKGNYKIFLEVRESNFAAINLYVNNGFTRIAERKKYYLDGETALIFVRG